MCVFVRSWLTANGLPLTVGKETAPESPDRADANANDSHNNGILREHEVGLVRTSGGMQHCAG